MEEHRSAGKTKRDNRNMNKTHIDEVRKEVACCSVVVVLDRR